MSKELEIDGVRFESSASVAQRFNYTQDYVGRLAREGKVTASRVGRFWFIDVSSFEKFIEDSEEEKRQRSQALREERKQERVAVTSNASASRVKKKRVIQVPTRTHTFAEQYAALAQAVAVVFCGLLVGALGWSAQELQLAQLERGAGAITAQVQEVFARVSDVAKENVTVSSSVQQALVIEAALETSVFAEFPVQSYDREFLPNLDTTETDTLYPFSDETQMVREEDGVQVVRPVFESTTEEVEYQVSAQTLKKTTR